MPLSGQAISGHRRYIQHAAERIQRRTGGRVTLELGDDGRWTANAFPAPERASKRAMRQGVAGYMDRYVSFLSTPIATVNDESLLAAIESLGSKIPG